MASRGDMQGALSLLRETLATQRQKEGDKHPEVLRTMNHLGWMLKGDGENDEAMVLLRQALEAQREVLGDRHPDTLTSINKLALLLQDQGDAEAVQLCQEALQVRTRTHTHARPRTCMHACMCMHVYASLTPPRLSSRCACRRDATSSATAIQALSSLSAASALYYSRGVSSRWRAPTFARRSSAHARRSATSTRTRVLSCNTSPPPTALSRTR